MEKIKEIVILVILLISLWGLSIRKGDWLVIQYDDNKVPTKCWEVKQQMLKLKTLEGGRSYVSFNDNQGNRFLLAGVLVVVRININQWGRVKSQLLGDHKLECFK